MTKISRSFRDKIREHLLESAQVKEKVARDCIRPILEAAELLINAFKRGNKVMICGNGGSAADAQHLASEFVGLLNRSFARPALPAISLTTDTSIITAQANDIGFENIFSRQISALGRSGDLLIAISTSGNSPNILAAVQTARSLQIQVVALTGKGGKLLKIADVSISVPSRETAYIQESHLVIEHILAQLVEYHFYGHK